MDDLAARLGHLVTLSGLDFKQIDKCAGLTSGHTGQIVRGGRKEPAATTLVALAGVLGTSAEYLVTGEGDPPGQVRVRRAVAAARERVRGGGRHAPKVAAAATASRGARRSAGATRTGDAR